MPNCSFQHLPRLESTHVTTYMHAWCNLPLLREARGGLSYEKVGGAHCTFQAPVVQKLDNAIHRINHYPVDSVVCFVNTYPLDSVIQPLNNWGQGFTPHKVYSASFCRTFQGIERKNITKTKIVCCFRISSSLGWKTFQATPTKPPKNKSGYAVD